MLRFEKMTVKAQEAVQSAQEVAAQHENQQMEPIHLLAALVAQSDGVVPPLLARLGIHTEALRSEEHTSELQSRSDLVCRLLLEKKKQEKHKIYHILNRQYIACKYSQ